MFPDLKYFKKEFQFGDMEHIEENESETKQHL
jgi:hypothetical protein